MAERGKSIWQRLEDDWLGDPLGTYEKKEAAQNAADTQAAAADAGIAEQRRQFDISRQILDPFVQSGYEAIGYSPSGQYTPSSPMMADMGGYTYQPNGFGGMQMAGNRVKPGLAMAGPAFASAAMQPGILGDRSYQRANIPSTGVNLRTFQSGYQQAQPTLSALQRAGEGAIPQLQDVARTGARAGGAIEDIASAGTGRLPQLTEYAEAGLPALRMQQAIAGTLGPEAQQEAYTQIESSPEVQYMMDKAKQGILSGGSATGNLRSGRTMSALMEYQPAILSQAIRDKYSQLSPLTSMGGQYAQNLYGTGANAAQNLYGTGTNIGQYLAGAGGNIAQQLRNQAQGVTSQLANIGQASAAGQAAGAMQTGTNIANLLAQKGAAQAGGIMAQPGTGIGEAAKIVASIYGMT